MNTPDLEKCLEMAEEGRRLWISYDEKYHFNRQRVPILMPAEGKSYHQELLDNMDEFIQTRELTDVLFMTEGAETTALVQKWKNQTDSTCNVVIESMLREDIEKIYKLNALYKFSRFLIIDAFEKVQDMDAHNLVGICGVTKRDVVRVAILGLPE